LKKINLNKEVINGGWIVSSLPTDLSQSHQGVSVSFFIKGVFHLRPNADPIPWEKGPGHVSGDIMIDGDKKKGLGYASDFVPYKPNADFSAIGTAYPPANATTHFLATMRVGDASRSIGVVGERLWKHHLLGEEPGVPAQVKPTRLSWNNARGGPNFPMNPLGMGDDGGKMHLLVDPNHLATSTHDQVPPALFAPFPSDSPFRRSKIGTYNKEWAATRWPWMPRDFDYSYYNAPDPRQWIKGYLRGDEELVFENMHPKIPIYNTRLPKLRARCFVNQTTNWSLDLMPEDAIREFHEVPMVLDTLWADMDEEKLVLVWRGHAPISSFKLQDIDHLVIATEPLGEPLAPKSHYQELLEAATAPKHPAAAELRKQKTEDLKKKISDKVSNALAAATKARSDSMAKLHEHIDELAKTNPEEANKIRDQVSTVLQTQSSGTAPPASSYAESMANLAKQIAESGDAMLATPNLSEEKKKEIVSEIERRKGLAAEAATKGGYQERKAVVDAKVAALFPPKKKLSEYQSGQQLDLPRVRAEGLENADLRGEDFSGLDLTGINFRGANIRGGSFAGCKLAGADFTKAKLSGVDLSEADLTGAILDGTNLSGCKVEKAHWESVSLNGTKFRGLDLSGADFIQVKGMGADFSKTNLTGACFKKASLLKCQFLKATIDHADFSFSQLVSSNFLGVSAKGVVMDDADLTGFRGGHGSDYTGGSFRRVNGEKSNWEKATLNKTDFVQAILHRARFCDSRINDAVFDRSDLQFSNFDDTLLRRSKLTHANLFKASFSRADLTQATLNGSNLYGACFWNTVLLHANWNGANILKTLLDR
jgi:uncharacterized protein YjbI with pentapeptide repeats